jgi:hypothetical protein
VRKRMDNVPKLTAAERQDVYLRMFLLNHHFYGIVQRLDELAGLLGKKNLKELAGLMQELQTETNHLILSKLESIEERDWAHFGKVRARMERRLREPPGNKSC